MQNRLTRAAAELGWLNAATYGMSKILAKISSQRLRLFKYYFVAQPVAEKPLLPAGRGRNIALRWVGRDDPVVAAFPRPPHVIRDRFDQGALCLVAEIDGRFAGFLWLLLGRYREDEVKSRFVPLPEGVAAWDFDVYVEPTYRVGFAFLRLWDEANRFLRERGVRWSVSRISAFNPGSLASHGRLGIRRIGSALFLAAGERQLMLADVAPYVHFSSSADGIPEVKLPAEE